MPRVHLPFIQKIEGLKQGYLRYEALHARIQQTAAEWSTLGGPGRAGDAALHGLLWPSSAPAPDPGVDALLHDVQRVSLFCRYQFDQTWSKLVGAVLELRATAEQLLRQGADAESASCHLDQLRKGLDGIGADAAALDAFFRHNVAACAHLAQLADAAPMPARDVGLDGRYLAAAESALLGTLRFDSIILGLSDCYELLRLMESDVAAAAAAVAGKVPMQRWVAPQEFRRATRKFWILPRNVTRFKMEVVKHLPVLIYGDRRKLTEGEGGS